VVVGDRDEGAEFRFVTVGRRKYMVRCHEEWASGLLYHGWLANWLRTATDRLRWYVTVESDDDKQLLPVLRESYSTEALARSRVAEICDGLEAGTVQLSRWPALIRRHRG
jgi:hypothetical protein